MSPQLPGYLLRSDLLLQCLEIVAAREGCCHTRANDRGNQEQTTKLSQLTQPYGSLLLRRATSSFWRVSQIASFVEGYYFDDFDFRMRRSVADSEEA